MVPDRYPDLTPDSGDIETAELHVSDDVLVKAFALGPSAVLEPHEHPNETNVIHVLDGHPTIIHNEAETQLTAPAVVVAQPGDTHGAKNQTDDTVVFTASLCPCP